MTAETILAAIPAVPQRRTQWGRALRALWRLARGEYQGDAIQEYTMALDGGEAERDFQMFLAEPGAARLLAQRSDLAAVLDDAERLRAMPPGSLGRAYLALAQRDRIRVGDLVEGFRKSPDYSEMCPDPARCWFADRGIGGHDLEHVLTEYDRTEPGETLLLAFMHARRPRRVLRVSLLMSLVMVPKASWFAFLRDLHRAWRRGRAARKERGIEWEELLPLPIDEARRRLGLAPLREAHPQGLWRIRTKGAGWERVPHAPGVAVPAGV